MEFSNVIKERYSVRKFEDRKVEKDKITAILEAGRIAPTAHNSGPQRIKVITSEEELKKIDECTPCRFGTSLVLLVCYDKDVSWKRAFDDKDSGFVDASIVTTHMMLAATDLELGSCWVMYFDPIKTIELFSLPENIVPVAFLPIGYPASDAKPSDSHSKRHSIEDMLI